MSSKTLRRADLGSLVAQLEHLENLKFDTVAPGSKIRSVDGRLVVSGADRELTLDGVSIIDFDADQTPQLRTSMANRLGVPVKYAERLFADWAAPDDREPGAPAPLRDLYDVTMNRLLAHQPGRKHLVRCYRRNGEPAEARVMLSANYRPMDNLLALYAALEAMSATGTPMEVVSADLSDRRMFVKVSCPEVAVQAPTLLRGYVSPYGGARGEENPTVFAGFVLSNSETGHGRLSITPVLTVQICSNGLVMNRDVVAKTHLGGELDEGTVAWGADTQDASRELVRLQVRDVVSSALTVDYVSSRVAELEAKAGKVVPDGQEEAVLTDIGGKLRWSEEERAGILRDFLRGNQPTSGGVMQAVTAYSQRVGDVDRAYELEAQGVQAMELVRA